MASKPRTNEPQRDERGDGVDQMSVGFCVPHLLPIASGLGILTTQMVKSERNGGFISSINWQRI